MEQKFWAMMMFLLNAFVFLTILCLAHGVADQNLAWDDADYLRDGLKVANSVRQDWGTRPGHVLGCLLRIKPKPPLLVGWIAAGGLVPALRSPTRLIAFASLIPFAGLLVAVATVTARRYGPWAAVLALLGVAGSPMALSFGAKVMVETFLSLWVVLALFSMARLLDGPSRGRATALGAVLGFACLTKMTVALLLPAPLIVTLVLLIRRHGPARTGAAVGWALAVGVLIAGPWYLKNGEAAIRFARFSAQYNLVALGAGVRVGPGDRLLAIGRDLIGWPLVAIAGLAGSLALRRRRRLGLEVEPTDDFLVLTLACFLSSTAVLLVPTYFDPRFLLPAWPAMAIGFGAVLVQIRPSRDRLAAFATAAALALAVFGSSRQLAAEPKTTTFWAARSLIDHLVMHHRAANLVNVGNCRDWNVSKTGLVNEFRPNPRDCFVLHDLSGSAPGEFLRRLETAEAVVALDRSKLPPTWFDYGPRLNQSCDFAVAHLRGDERFRRVEDFPTADLPPILVFVRRDLQTARAVDPTQR